jgi:hypothetical protein
LAFLSFFRCLAWAFLLFGAIYRSPDGDLTPLTLTMVQHCRGQNVKCLFGFIGRSAFGSSAVSIYLHSAPPRTTEKNTDKRRFRAPRSPLLEHTTTWNDPTTTTTTTKEMDTRIITMHITTPEKKPF